MCLPVYRLFWVSSLAYPNLLGTKGYVVVVVVVVVVTSVVSLLLPNRILLQVPRMNRVSILLGELLIISLLFLRN
jgi:hypothetical protein